MHPWQRTGDDETKDQTMTTMVDGLSWKAIGVIAGITLPIIGLLVGMIWRVESRVERLRDEMHREFVAVRADIADIKTDLADIKTDMVVVIALLERVERGQSAGSIPAKPSARPAKLGSPGQPEASRGSRPIGNPATDTASK